MEMQAADTLAAYREGFDFSGRDKRNNKDCIEQFSDEELVDQANNGQWWAFESLVKRYQEQFFRLACGYFDTEADAHDVVQDAFLKIHRNLDSFRGDAQFKSWAYRIVVNTALSRLRKHKRRGEVPLENVSPSVEDDAEPVATLASWRMRADDIAENHELRQHIVDAVAELEPKYRSIFLLYEVEGLAIAEISEVVELSVPGIKSRLHRARLHLRATLERYLNESERLTDAR
jgi:RNA polymerase sigma-70 factor (ECF subfamily)